MKKYGFILFFILFFPLGLWAKEPCRQEILNLRNFPEHADKYSQLADQCIDQLTGAIILGNRAAIANGVTLLNITDGGYSLSIKVSLAYALEDNPEAVLSFIKTDTDLVLYVCGMNFIEPERKFLENYVKNTNKNLLRLSFSPIKDTAAQCRTHLNSTCKVFFGATSNICK